VKEASEALYIYPLHHILLPWDEAHCWLTPSIQYSRSRQGIGGSFVKNFHLKKKKKKIFVVHGMGNHMCVAMNIIRIAFL